MKRKPALIIIIFTFLIISILYLGIKNKKTSVVITSTPITITDFENIKLGTSYSDIQKQFGSAKDIGSGLHIFTYTLSDKTQILLGFADLNNLLYIKHKLNNGTIEDINPKSATNEIINSATFYCTKNKNIKAVFYANKVEITLSDGRNMSLPQVISASGARYANSDESFVFWNKGDTAFINENDKTTYENCAIKTDTTQIANPASVNCINKSGQSKIQTKPDGSQYSLCYFEENRACEEWALYRGECPVGGRKTTGYDTIAQSYCAWSGGQTYAVENAICTFGDGSTCPADAFYSASCQKGTK